MILKKIINENGETIYVSVREDDVNLDDEDIIFTTEEEKESFKKKMKKIGEDIKTEFKKLEEGLDQTIDSSKVKEWADVIVENTSKAFNYAMNEVSDKINSIKSYKEKVKKTNTKTSKLIDLLPCMEDEEIHELAMMLVSDDQNLKNIDLEELFPYFTSEDCSMIFLKAIRDGNSDFDIEDILPFVNDECLSALVDLYVNDKIKLNMDACDLYPYLCKEDIKKIFKYIMESDK